LNYYKTYGKIIKERNNKMKRYTQNKINELADILKKDGVISVPTDTVYGLCARINSIKAHDNLVVTKNRPSSKLFPIMCADKEQIKSIAIVDEKIEKLICTFMPGPITLILRKRPELPEYINNGSLTIAVRMATSKALEDLIRETGSPIFMTSANQSGEPICTNLDEIEKACPTLDGMMEGNVSFGKGSTIVDCIAEPIKILREGPISMEQIIEALKY
jgi:L-threonylcarbamoyladenylate synthase